MDLNDLKQFHWEETMYYRKRAKLMREQSRLAVASVLDKMADKHINFVDLLQDYITAENMEKAL